DADVAVTRLDLSVRLIGGPRHGKGEIQVRDGHLPEPLRYRPQPVQADEVLIPFVRVAIGDFGGDDVVDFGEPPIVGDHAGLGNGLWNHLRLSVTVLVEGRSRLRPSLRRDLLSVSISLGPRELLPNLPCLSKVRGAKDRTPWSPPRRRPCSRRLCGSHLAFSSQPCWPSRRSRCKPSRRSSKRLKLRRSRSFRHFWNESRSPIRPWISAGCDSSRPSSTATIRTGPTSRNIRPRSCPRETSKGRNR